MTTPIRVTARLTCIAIVLAGVPLVPAQQTGKPFLRIISPANGAVARPAQKLAVKVTGAGNFRGVLVLGEIVTGALDAPMGKPPWLIPVEIPLSANLGKTSIIAIGATASGDDVESNDLEIDVEPAEIPPVTFDPSALFIPLGGCIVLTNTSHCSGLALSVYGTYADGTQAYLNQSTKITFVSRAPSIAALNRDGTAILGRSPGSTKIVVFGKYAIDVTVR